MEFSQINRDGFRSGSPHRRANVEASHPLNQFCYQLSREQERIQDELQRGGPHRNANTDDETYNRFKNRWKEWGIWKIEWGKYPGYVMEARRSPLTGRPHSADSDLVNNIIEQMPQNSPHTQGPTASADSERFDRGDLHRYGRGKTCGVLTIGNVWRRQCQNPCSANIHICAKNERISIKKYRSKIQTRLPHSPLHPPIGSSHIRISTCAEVNVYQRKTNLNRFPLQPKIYRQINSSVSLIRYRSGALRPIV